MFRNDRTTDPKIFMSFLAGVILPLVQAGVSGFFLGSLTLALSRLAGANEPVTNGLIVGSGSAVIAWFAGLRWWRVGLGVENKDLTTNQNNQVLRVEISRNNGRTLQYADLPGRPDQLRALAVGLLEGRSFTEAAWCAGPNSVFTRAEFVQLRDELIARKLAYWKSPGTPARGAGITYALLAIMRDIVRQSPTPAGEPAPELRVYQ